MGRPKVSVIIPVYNVQSHLEACVRSVMEQTLRDIEIICVDDASTDGSLSILRTLAASDGRIVVIVMDMNMSASQARKNGVLASAGETIMFLDGDDILMPEACETAYCAIQAQQVDVLHYDGRVINRSDATQDRIAWNQRKIAPCLERIEGDLVLACFRDERFFFTLWNKMFRGDLARLAFRHIKDGAFPRAQDLYATFILLHFAKTYAGIPSALVHYNFGTGITGNACYDLSRFSRFCQASAVADAIAEFVREHGLEGAYGGVVSKIRRGLLADGLAQWMNHLRPEDKGPAYRLLAENWTAHELVTALAEKHITDPDRFGLKELAESLQGLGASAIDNNRQVKTIAVYYHRYHSGGVQRVISLLIPLFIRWGHEVVLITEERVEDGEYPLPEGVKRVLVPRFVNKKGDALGARFAALADALKSHNVDVLSYHATSSTAVLFDTVLAKTLGCAVILSRHELAFSSLLSGTEAPVRQPSVFALADALTVLTRMDEQFYQLMGVRALYIPNPLPSFKIQPIRAHEASPTIVWVGRMDFIQKQCREPIEIMREVVRYVPNARLVMIGGGWSSGAEESLVDRVHALGLKDNVEIVGYTPNPETYYREAACHLMTSSWENYPMIIEESRAFGLPLILYEMPYLELLRSGRGFIAVGQSDRRAAASAIVRVLQDVALREKMGREAQEELANADNALLEDRWKELLSSGSAVNRAEELDSRRLRMLFDNILHLYGRGIRRKNGEISKLKRELLASTRSGTRSCSELHAKVPSGLADKSGGRERLDALLARRKRYGSIGVIDFLIEVEEARIHEQV